MTLEQLEDALLESAAGLLAATHEDAPTRDCAIRLALDVYGTVLDLRIRAVASGVADVVEPAKKKDRN
jgi:hypothetical protein